jgi:hypothetical protein
MKNKAYPSMSKSAVTAWGAAVAATGKAASVRTQEAPDTRLIVA